MDMAGNHKLRAIITDYYEKSPDPKLVQSAIETACDQSMPSDILGTFFQKVWHALCGAKRYYSGLS